MFRFRLVRWLIHAYGDVARALRSIASPWLDAAAVKTMQVDLVNTFAAQQTEIAEARAAIDTIKQEIAQLTTRVAEQDAAIHSISTRLGCVNRKPPEDVEATSISSN